MTGLLTRIEEDAVKNGAASFGAVRRKRGCLAEAWACWWLVGWRCGVNRGASAGSFVDRRADVPQKLSTEMESTNGKHLCWREMGKTEKWAGAIKR